MAEREEKLILDPAEVAVVDRAELDLHADNIRVLPEGIDWGTAEIEAFMAQQQMGEKPIDYRLPNRIIKIPLILGATGDFDAARVAVQAKVSRINEEGGWLKRELIGGSYGPAGSRVFCDLVKATLKMGGSIYVASSGFDPDAELELEALPDFYGDSEELATREGTGDLAFTEQIKGNLPGRVDLEVLDQFAQVEADSAFLNAEAAVVEDLARIRQAIAGKVKEADRADVEAVRAALVRQFEKFVLHREGVTASLAGGTIGPESTSVHLEDDQDGMRWLEPVPNWDSVEGFDEELRPVLRREPLGQAAENYGARSVAA